MQDDKAIVESTTEASEVLRRKEIKGYAAFIKYSETSGWSHATGAVNMVSNPDPILPYGWYRNRDDAVIAGSASYYKGNTIKILTATFELY